LLPASEFTVVYSGLQLLAVVGRSWEGL